MGIAYEDPAAYYGNESFMENLKRGASFRCLRGAVEIGEPIVVDDLTAVELKDLARQQVVELVAKARSRIEAKTSPLLFPTWVGQGTDHEQNGDPVTTRPQAPAPASKRS